MSSTLRVARDAYASAAPRSVTKEEYCAFRPFERGEPAIIDRATPIARGIHDTRSLAEHSQDLIDLVQPQRGLPLLELDDEPLSHACQVA